MSVKEFHKLARKTFRDERKFQIFILESSIDFLPRGIKKPIYKEAQKNELLEKYGEDSFLIPDQLLFPIKNINTGLIDDRLVKYALIRSLALKRISHEYDYIYDAALKCYKDNNCEDSIKITVLDSNEEVGLIEYLTRLDKLDGKQEFEIPEVEKLSPEEFRMRPDFKPHYKKYKRI